MRTLVALSSVAMLAACSSPPKPPVVDGSNRQVINSPETDEVIALRAQLAQSQAKLQQEQARLVVSPATVQPVPPTPISQTFSVHFPVNGTNFQLSADESAHLSALLAKARRVEVRGRTDGQHSGAADEKVALNRALAAQRYLIGQGVSPAIISVNYVSAGDYVGDNFSAVGRSQNRRVDIEVFNR